MTTSPLVLGPMMRFVDETSASVWVETRSAARVSIRAGGRDWEARTFAVHGHHYALVELDGLEPGTVTRYALDVNGTQVWPDPSSGFPPSMIATLKPGKPLRMAYGSCRTSVPHDESGNRTHGVDSLRAYALKMASGGDLPWPDLVAFLGDQVYADLTSEQMQEFIRARRDIKAPPGEELKDYEEYAHLYYLAWSDPANRWLLSTLPSAMIFDDHDIRDDWNTSLSWKKKMEATSWWHERIVAGLASYWVYQHLGNLSPAGTGRGCCLAADRPARGRGRDRRERGTGQFRGPGRSGPGIVPVELLQGFRGHAADCGGFPSGPGPDAGQPRPGGQGGNGLA